MSLEKDWRFARVTLDAQDGDVETAIKLFEGYASPELVIIQTEDIDDRFSENLEALAGSCSEGTSAIIIGPVNDVNLYRKLVGMGISDYLVKPVPPDVLANEVAETLIEQLGTADSRLIAVMGAKGGIGTTSIAGALAWASADALKQKTFLLDAAGGWSTLSVGLNFKPTTNLPEAVRAAVEGNEDSLTRMLFSASDKLSILSSGSDIMLDDTADAEGYEALLVHLMSTHPVVFADLSASPADLKRVVLSQAHEVFLVTAPTLASIRASRTLIQEIKELRGDSDGNVELILNMQGMVPKHEVSKTQIEEGLDRKISVTISYNPALFVSAESEARKLSDDKAGSDVVKKLLPLLQAALAGVGGSNGLAGLSDEDKKSGVLGQFLNKLTVKS